MNKKNILIGTGILIYIMISLTDKYLMKIESFIYLPIVLLSIILMLIGIIKRDK